jgi:hypothetical protein
LGAIVYHSFVELEDNESKEAQGGLFTPFFSANGQSSTRGL